MHHESNDAVEPRTRASLRTQRSFEASRASRLLDVSPPALSMTGLTSDSDYGSNPRRKELPPLAPSPRSRDIERDGVVLSSDTDEWDFAEPQDSDGQRVEGSSHHWASQRKEQVWN